MSSVNPGKPREETNRSKSPRLCVGPQNATKSIKKSQFFFFPVNRFESAVMFRELRGRVC